MRNLIALCLLLLTATAALAQAVPYRLQPEQSTVGFDYLMAGQRMSGRMPLESAEIALDFRNPANSRVIAVLRPDRADAGPDYATAAMRSESVLDTARYPRITFRSQSITRSETGATLDGTITIRDVTRPIRLEAQFFRQRGTEAGDRSRLSVVMRGAISRQAFGASGYGGLVGDRIDLTIVARIARDE